MVCWILVLRIHGFLEIFKATLNLSCRHAISSLGMGMGLLPRSRPVGSHDEKQMGTSHWVVLTIHWQSHSGPHLAHTHMIMEYNGEATCQEYFF